LRQGRFHDTAALVACRSDDLLNEGIGHAINVVVGIHHEKVHRPHESAGANRRPEGEDRPADHLTPNLGDEDAGLREVDQLSEQVRWRERTRSVRRPDGSIAQGDEPIDVGDASGSNQIFHAGWCHLVGPAVAICHIAVRSDPHRFQRGLAGWRAVGSAATPGSRWSVLQSVRRCI
jgi:hypothetical protein